MKSQSPTFFDLQAECQQRRMDLIAKIGYGDIIALKMDS